MRQRRALSRGNDGLKRHCFGPGFAGGVLHFGGHLGFADSRANDFERPIEKAGAQNAPPIEGKRSLPRPSPCGPARPGPGLLADGSPRAEFPRAANGPPPSCARPQSQSSRELDGLSSGAKTTRRRPPRAAPGERSRSVRSALRPAVLLGASLFDHALEVIRPGIREAEVAAEMEYAGPPSRGRGDVV